MYNGLARGWQRPPLWVGNGPRCGHGILDGVPGCEKVSCQPLLRIWKRIRDSDTDPGEDEWFGQGMLHVRLWMSGRDPSVYWAWWLVTVFGKELVRGVQCVWHGVHDL